MTGRRKAGKTRLAFEEECAVGVVVGGGRHLPEVHLRTSLHVELSVVETSMLVPDLV
jgi:hypothetical protein